MSMTGRQKLIRSIQIKLGAGMIDLELDQEHYEYAVDAAIDRYRQRSGNAMEESFLFVDLQPNVQTYFLPPEVQDVRSIYRRGIGSSGGGAAVDPFSLAFTNNVYLLQNPGGLAGSGGSGTLATYDFAVQYQELIGRMFGREMTYTWDPVSHKLTLHRNILAIEQIMIHVFNARPEDILFNDPYSKPWIRDWAAAQCKMMMGEARSKFQSLGGPQGGVSLNGDSLKNEAKEEFDRLEEEVKTQIDDNYGYTFIIG